jgi:hypothetical protein
VTRSRAAVPSGRCRVLPVSEPGSLLHTHIATTAHCKASMPRQLLAALRGCVRLCRSLQPPTPFNPRFRQPTHAYTRRAFSVAQGTLVFSTTIFLSLCGQPHTSETPRSRDRRSKVEGEECSHLRCRSRSSSRSMTTRIRPEMTRGRVMERESACLPRRSVSHASALRARAPVLYDSTDVLGNAQPEVPLLAGELSLTRVPRASSDPSQGGGPGHQRGSTGLRDPAARRRYAARPGHRQRRRPGRWRLQARLVVLAATRPGERQR